MTNYEWIKSFSVADMAKELNGSLVSKYVCGRILLGGFCAYVHGCEKCIENWLNSEHKENENGSGND